MAQTPAFEVVADYPHGDRDRTQRANICSHVCSASQAGCFLLDFDDGHRGFRADPAHRSPDEPVEHEIADHQDPPVAELEHCFGKRFGIALELLQYHVNLSFGTVTHARHAFPSP